MPRPKGSRNIKPALTPRYNPNRKKSQFANTKMADKLLADLTQAGKTRYPYVKAEYKKLYDNNYYCIAGFDKCWERLLKKIAEVHGVDVFLKHHKQVTAEANYIARLAEHRRKQAEQEDKPYRRNLQNPPLV